jgi:hypothetical protein
VEVRAADAEYGIVTEAWSPIAKGRLLNDPTIARSPLEWIGRLRRWCFGGTFNAGT